MANVNISAPILKTDKVIQYYYSSSHPYPLISYTLPTNFKLPSPAGEEQTKVRYAFIRVLDPITGEMLVLKNSNGTVSTNYMLSRYTSWEENGAPQAKNVWLQLISDITKASDTSYTVINEAGTPKKAVHIQMAFCIDPNAKNTPAYVETHSEMMSPWSNVQVTYFSKIKPVMELTAKLREDGIPNTFIISQTSNANVSDRIAKAQFILKQGSKIISSSSWCNIVEDNAISWCPPINLDFYSGNIQCECTWVTELGYGETKTSTFSNNPQLNQDSSKSLMVSSHDGYNTITMNYADTGTLLRRAPNEDTQVIYTKTSPAQATWDDFTIDSNRIYTYEFQTNFLYWNSEAIYNSNEFIQLLDVTGILTIKFNPQVTGLKRTITDATLTPLGSAYPIVRRNGATQYQQFSLGGLISYETELAESRAIKTYSIARGLDFNPTGLSDGDKEFYNERIFRERVLDFLYNDNVKLLKSPTEGNMLVRLTNVSLTPNQQLGNMIYSFTTQCIEVAPATEENCNRFAVRPV